MSLKRTIGDEKRLLGPGADRVWRSLAAAGAALLLAGVGLAAISHGGWARFLHAWVLGYAYVLTLVLGGLFFVILQHLTRAGWSVVLRRLAEALAAAVPALPVLLLPVLAGVPSLYHWSHADAVAADPLLAVKAPYLNVPFFVVRWVVYLGVWWVLARFFVGTSLAQDVSRDGESALLMQRRAAPAMVAFALTFTFAFVDLLMSLDAHWFSTIFGVHVFAGAAVATVAAVTVLAVLLQRAGYLTGSITVEHYHDLGKLLFAFTVFWAYIAFSQYMLYWYANIPEETAWYLRRLEHGWGTVGLALVVGHFAVPFLALLSRAGKRRPRLLAAVAVWVLVMHFVDLYWLVMPQASPESAVPQPVDALVWLGMVALTLAFVALRMRRHALLAEGDPRLAESQAFENA